jgi:protein SCO1/2
VTKPFLFAVQAALAVFGAACATSHVATGLVLRVDPATSRLTISHDEVPGVMEPMVMPFDVRGASKLAGVRPGDRVSFRLVVRKDGSHIDRVRLLSAAPADAGLVMTPATSTLVPIGSTVPDFSLIDQRGAPVSLASLRGRVVVVTFIYTRCPLPDYCPRMITNLAAVRERFRERVGTDLALLTITFDPQYDTPERLAAFAISEKDDFEVLYFLSWYF